MLWTCQPASQAGRKKKGDDMSRQQIAYSPAEERLLKLIPRNGRRITTDKLTAMQYQHRQKPFNADAIVRATLRSLMKKVEFNQERYRIVKGPQRGPHTSEIWSEKRT
jgi:hypothetical protein